MKDNKLRISLSRILLSGLFAITLILSACGGGSATTTLPTTTPTGSETVAFPDANLDALIREALSKPVGEDITIDKLASLTHLWANNSGITDLSGLEYCTNLRWLRLSGNQIRDISPLVDTSGLGEGDNLWLDNNNLDLKLGSDDIENIKALKDRGIFVVLFVVY